MVSGFRCKILYHVKKAERGKWRGRNISSLWKLRNAELAHCQNLWYSVRGSPLRAGRCTRRRAVSHTTPKGGDANADHITYRAVHRYDYCEKQKPPPGRVTASRLLLWSLNSHGLTACRSALFYVHYRPPRPPCQALGAMPGVLLFLAPQRPQERFCFKWWKDTRQSSKPLTGHLKQKAGVIPQPLAHIPEYPQADSLEVYRCGLYWPMIQGLLHGFAAKHFHLATFLFATYRLNILHFSRRSAHQFYTLLAYCTPFPLWRGLFHASLLFHYGYYTSIYTENQCIICTEK